MAHPVPPHEVDRAAMGHDDPLGVTCGARGVDAVRGVLGARTALRRMGRGPALDLLHQAHGPRRFVRPDPGVAGEDGGGGQQRHRRAVVEQPGQPGGGQRRVERQVGGAALEHPQHSHDQLRAAREQQGHPLAGRGSSRAQVVGERVRPAVQFAVPDGSLSAHQRDGPRGPPCLALEQPVQGVLHGRLRLVQAPHPRESCTVGAARGRQLPQRRVRGTQGPAQDLFHVVREAGDGGLVEQGRVVLHHEPHTLRVVGEVDAQVERGSCARHVDQGRRRPGGVELHRTLVLVLHHHLEERVPSRVPAWGEFLDQCVEGDSAVLEGGGGGRAHSVQQGGEVRVATRSSRSGTVSRKRPTWWSAPRPGAEDGAEDHVLLAAQPPEYRRDGTGQGHEQGDAGPGRERLQRAGEFRVEFVGEACPLS